MTNSSYLSSKVVPDFCDLVYISVRAIDIYVIPLISDNTFVIFTSVYLHYTIDM